jgi:transposase InsO family protein
MKQKVTSFLKIAENTTGNRITTLRTDNGLEFMNKELQYFLEKNGICHQRSVVYTPQQNRRAERKIRTIVEAARTMLHSRNMSKVFWVEVVNSTVFVLNRTSPSPQNNHAPFKLWYLKEIDMDIFRIFGSRLAAHIPKEKRLKLDAKSKKNIRRIQREY